MPERICFCGGINGAFRLCCVGTIVLTLLLGDADERCCQTMMDLPCFIVFDVASFTRTWFFFSYNYYERMRESYGELWRGDGGGHRPRAILVNRMTFMIRHSHAVVTAHAPERLFYLLICMTLQSGRLRENIFFHHRQAPTFFLASP